MSQRVVLVTGTSRGIGRALAEHFLKCGYIVVGCSRSGDNALGPNYIHHALDLQDEAAVRAMFADIRQRYGRLDILVNNAGVGLASLVMMTQSKTAESVFNTNFIGTFTCCREAVKLMMKAKFGRIINISSIAVSISMDGSGVYSASKAAIEQFTRVLAKEVATFGITCNTVVPSLVETEMFHSLTDAARDKYLSAMTIKNCATMADMINAVEFFGRVESGAITGQRLALSHVG